MVAILVAIGTDTDDRQAGGSSGSTLRFVVGGRPRTQWLTLQNLYSPVRIRSSPPLSRSTSRSRKPAFGPVFRAGPRRLGHSEIFQASDTEIARGHGRWARAESDASTATRPPKAEHPDRDRFCRCRRHPRGVVPDAPIESRGPGASPGLCVVRSARLRQGGQHRSDFRLGGRTGDAPDHIAVRVQVRHVACARVGQRRYVLATDARLAQRGRLIFG